LTTSGAASADGRGRRTGAASSAPAASSSRLAKAVGTRQILPGAAVGLVDFLTFTDHPSSGPPSRGVENEIAVEVRSGG
jgi:hypothetical protein